MIDKFDFGMSHLQILEGIEAATTLLFVTSKDGKVLYTNRIGRSLFPRWNDAVSNPVLRALETENGRKFDLSLISEIANQEIWNGKNNIITLEDSTALRVNLIGLSLDTNEKDKAVLFVGAFGKDSHDIIQKTKSNDATQEPLSVTDSITFLKTIIDNIPNMIFLKDSDKLNFVYINKAGVNLTGFLENDLVGKNDSDFFPKEQADFFTAKDREVIEGNKVVDIPEEAIKTKSQGVRYLHTKKVPVTTPDGRQFLIGISEDVTEKKHAHTENVKSSQIVEARLEEKERTIKSLNDKLAQKNQQIEKLLEGLEGSENQLRLVGNALPMLIAYFDPDMTYTFANMAYEKWCGKHVSEILGQSIESILGADFAVIARSHLPTVMSGHPVDFVAPATDLMGRKKEVRVMYLPEQDSTGKVRGFIEVTQDVTDRKRQEEKSVRITALEQSVSSVQEVKTEVVAIMSDAIRPLAKKTMDLVGEMLEDKTVSKSRDWAESIKTFVNNILGTLDLASNLAATADDRTASQEVVFDLVSTFQDIEKYFIDLHKGTDFRIALELDPKLPLFVRGTPTHLRQVIMNLVEGTLRNATSVRVLIRVFVTDETLDHSTIEVQVEDQKSQLPTTSTKTNTPFSEFNINTSLTRRLVGQMGGEMGVKAAANGGSLCWVRVVFRIANQQFQSNSAPFDSSKIALDQPQNFRILVAEDNLLNQKDVLRMLGKMGFQANAVMNGEEALKELRVSPYDLVLMDCQMPQMDGYQTSTVIRRDVNLPSHIPIIAMTANGIKGDSERCLEAGMDDYIAKPLSEKRLLTALNKWINRINRYKSDSHKRNQ